MRNDARTMAHVSQVHNFMPISIDPVAFPQLMENVGMSQTFSVTDGVLPIAWTISAKPQKPLSAVDSGVNSATPSALPMGLVLDPNSGTVSGTPLIAQHFRFVICATDALGNSDFMEISGDIARNPNYSPTIYINGAEIDPLERSWTTVVVAMKQPGIPLTGRISLEFGGQQMDYIGGDTIVIPRYLVAQYRAEGLIV